MRGVINFFNVLLFSRLSGMTVEFDVAGKTFQITGDPRMEGGYERFFHIDSHPTRRRVGEKEMNQVLRQAKAFVLYEFWKDEGQTVNRRQLAYRIRKYLK